MARLDKADTIDNAVQGMIKDSINRFKDTEAEAPPPEESPDPVVDLFSSIPEAEGYYIKIYRKYPVPKEYGMRPVFLSDIEQPENVHDLESEILRLAKINNWCNGLYEVRLLKKGEPGIRASKKISLEIPTAASSSVVFPQGSSIDQISQVADLLQKLGVHVNRDSGNGGGPEVIKGILEAFAAGSKSQPTPPQSPLATTALPELIKALKDFAPPIVPVPPTSSRSEAELIRSIGEMFRASKPPEVDVFGTLIRMKQAGFFPEPPPQQDPSMKVIEMVTTLLPLLDRGGEGKPTIGIELLRLLAPKIPEMVSNVTSTISTLAKAKSERLNPKSPRPNPNLSLLGSSTPLPSRPPDQGQEGGATVKPSQEQSLVSIIKRSIETHDTTIFPRMAHWLGSAFGDEYLATLQGDRLITTLSAFPGYEFLGEPEAKVYVEEFVGWYNINKAPTKEEIVVKCNICKEEYDIESEAVWEATSDEEKKCDVSRDGVVCQGVLQKAV